MPTIYLSLGSNLGNRRLHIKQAKTAISHWPKSALLASSSLYETLPQGFTKQSNFFNCVVKIKTDLLPTALLLWAKMTELAIGRRPGIRWGPRKLDIDILFYGGETFKNALLAIPHPRLHQRAFVLVGLMELCPGLIHPKLKSSVRQMWQALSETRRQSVWRGTSPFRHCEPQAKQSHEENPNEIAAAPMGPRNDRKEVVG